MKLKPSRVLAAPVQGHLPVRPHRAEADRGDGGRDPDVGLRLPAPRRRLAGKLRNTSRSSSPACRPTRSTRSPARTPPSSTGWSIDRISPSPAWEREGPTPQAWEGEGLAARHPHPARLRSPPSPRGERGLKEKTMAYDLLIKNGRIVDGSGMPAFRGDVGVKDGKIAEIGKLSGAADAAPSMPTATPSRPALSTTIAITTRRSPGTRCARSRREHGATIVIFGNCSLSLAPVRKGTEERAGRVPLLCRSDPDGGARHRRFRLGDDPAIHGPARQPSRRQCRQPDRPHGGAPLRDGRRVPEARRHRRRDQGRCRTSCATA